MKFGEVWSDRLEVSQRFREWEFGEGGGWQREYSSPGQAETEPGCRISLEGSVPASPAQAQQFLEDLGPREGWAGHRGRIKFHPGTRISRAEGPRGRTQRAVPSLCPHSPSQISPEGFWQLPRALLGKLCLFYGMREPEEVGTAPQTPREFSGDL